MRNLSTLKIESFNAKKKMNPFKKEFTTMMLGPGLVTTAALRMMAELASLASGELVAAALCVGK